MEFLFRHLNKSDMASVLAIEDAWNTYIKEDIDFGKLVLKTGWAIESFDIGEVAKTKASLMVIESNKKIVGFFIFDSSNLAIDLDHFSLNPSLPKENQVEAVNQVIRLLKKNASKERIGKLITYFVRDREEAHIRTILPCFMKAGFNVSLARDHFDGDTDGWKCTFQVPSVGKSDNMELTCP